MKPVLAGFEDFVPLLLFFFIWWISSQKKKARRSQSSAPPASTAGKARAVGGLQEILKQLLVGEVEMPLPMEPRSLPGLPESPDTLEDDVLLDLEQERQEFPVLRQQPPITRPQPAVCQSPARMRPRRGELRRAVVWSEILAPPVGLRQD